MTQPYDGYAGVDWASQTHHVCVTDQDGRKAKERSFPHGGEGLLAMAKWIQAQTGAEVDRIAVGIEVPHGPVVEGLAEQGFHVHAINPKQLDRFRDRFSPAGSKDDSKDALVLASSLRTDRHCFRKVDIADPEAVEIRMASREIQELKEERVRVAHRVRQKLWRYYPAMLDASRDPCEPWIIELWRRAPTPEQGKRLRLSTLEALLKKHRIRRISARELKDILGQTPMRVVPGVASGTVKYLGRAFKRLEILRGMIQDAQTDLDLLLDNWIDGEASDRPAGPRQETRLPRAQMPRRRRTRHTKIRQVRHRGSPTGRASAPPQRSIPLVPRRRPTRSDPECGFV